MLVLLDCSWTKIKKQALISTEISVKTLLAIERFNWKIIKLNCLKELRVRDLQKPVGTFDQIKKKTRQEKWERDRDRESAGGEHLAS